MRGASGGRRAGAGGDAMDITPRVPDGRQVIESYSGAGFRVNGARHEGAILIWPESVEAWPAAAIETLSEETFATLFTAEPPIEILLVGGGDRFRMIPGALKRSLSERGISVECMDTGAACRTYNVLMAEDRRVAAALLPPT